MRVALISSYELGHQPLHVAAPAASLGLAGHQVRTLDLAVEQWDEALFHWAEAVAFSTPMHTALRLSMVAAQRLRLTRPDVPIAAYGLYAAMATGDHPFDRLIAGEYETDLAAWLDSDELRAPEIVVSTSTRPTAFSVPDRRRLPALSRYAQLEIDSTFRLVGAVEASHGCIHRCRHCPLPSVYDGRIRIVDRDIVLDDISQLVEGGVEHITFADPDFFNGPHHGVRITKAMHDRWPSLTFDVTIKVEHLLRHDRLLPTLVDTGCLFVVSAFESVNDQILTILDKGHTAEDASRAVHRARAIGLDIRPTWLPFTPWTGLEDVIDIFSFIAAHDLIGLTDPVQMAIRLLVPPLSLLADHPDFLPHRRAYNDGALSYDWVAMDPEVDHLAADLARIAEERISDQPVETFMLMWKTVLASVGRSDELEAVLPPDSTERRPRLTESWFC